MMNIPFIGKRKLQKEKIQKLAEIYLINFIATGNYNLNSKKDRNELKKEIKELDLLEYLALLRKNKLKKKTFRKFKKCVKKELGKLLKEYKKDPKEEKQSPNVQIEINQLFEYIKWENLSKKDQNKMYQTFLTMNDEIWQNIVMWNNNNKAYSEIELNNMKKAFLQQMQEQLTTNKSQVDFNSIISKYVGELNNLDYSAYEKLMKYLNVENLKNDNQELSSCNERDLQLIIQEINKQGKEIALRKLLELKEVKKYVEPFQSYIKNNLLTYEMAEKEISNLPNNITCNDFNRKILQDYLRKCLKSNQRKTENKKIDPTTIINNIKEFLKASSLKDNITFYNGLNNCEKDYLYCEHLNDLEFQKVKEETKQITIQTITEKIWKNNKTLQDQETLIRPNLKQYQMPIELEDLVLIEIEKNRQLKTQFKYYHLEDQVLACSETIEKKGKVKGYYVQMNNQLQLITTEEELISKMNAGYELKGYEVEFTKNSEKYKRKVKKENIFPSKTILEKITNEWQAKLVTLVVVGLIIGGLIKVDKDNKNSNEPEIEDITKNLNNEDVLTEEEDILREINKTREEYAAMRQKLIEIQNNMANYQENNTNEIVIGDAVLPYEGTDCFPDVYSLMKNDKKVAADCNEEEIKIILGKIFEKNGVIEIAKSEEVAQSLINNNFQLISYIIGNQNSLDENHIVEEGKVRSDDVRKVRIR